MGQVSDLFRKITKNPLEAIGYVLAGSLVLTALYLLNPWYAGQAEGVTQYVVGIFYLVCGFPYVVRGWKQFPLWITALETNLVFVGHLFTTIFILIAVGLTPLYWLWAAVCAAVALIVHLWVVRTR